MEYGPGYGPVGGGNPGQTACGCFSGLSSRSKISGTVCRMPVNVGVFLMVKELARVPTLTAKRIF